MRTAAKSEISTGEACDETRAIYQALADRPIERSCERRKDCCHFKLTGRAPLLTKGEAILAATALRQNGRTRLPSAPSGVCPMLNVATGDCIIYQDRPFGCRTHFCAAAGGPYGRSEVLDLIRRLEDLDHRLGGDGVHKIERAIADALALSS
jgi:Fe-S-cluster containining protein